MEKTKYNPVCIIPAKDPKKCIARNVMIALDLTTKATAAEIYQSFNYRHLERIKCKD